jgi:glycosyltransferase involved in cell wall biosynthesis
MATSVLHVIEAGGGGVLTALNGWIHSATEFDHTIFMAKRIDSFSELVWPDNVEWIIASDGFLDMAISYRKLLKSNDFDLIHFHSSKAGLLRIFNPNAFVIYSPHCFAFERTGRKSPLNVFIYLIEKMLARTTQYFAVVSERERYLAQRLNPSAKVEIVSFNVVKWARSQPKNKIVAVGRICYQKNPMEFIEIVNMLRVRNAELDFVWIGDGDLESKQSLIRIGVRVTGWIEPSKLIDELKDAAVLLHTARWEGMPMVFAEALAGGIPMVVRNCKYLAHDSILEEIFVYDTRFEAVQECENILSNALLGNAKKFESGRVSYKVFLKKIADGVV